MSTIQQPHDLETAHDHGEAFGREIGNRIATEMMRANPTRADLTSIGSEGVSLILAKAGVLADAGVDPDTVTAWTDAAADAFLVELERAAALLNAREASASKH